MASRNRRHSVLLLASALAFGVVVAGVSAKNMKAHACMEGNDTVKSTAFLSVYCGPASAVVTTKGTSKKPLRAGTCVTGLRGAGSFDLYLGTDKSGGGPWPRTLHLFKPGHGQAGCDDGRRIRNLGRAQRREDRPVGQRWLVLGYRPLPIEGKDHRPAFGDQGDILVRPLTRARRIVTQFTQSGKDTT